MGQLPPSATQPDLTSPQTFPLFSFQFPLFIRFFCKIIKALTLQKRRDKSLRRPLLRSALLG